MQFTLRSALLFTAGVAAVASAASAFGREAGLVAMVLFVSTLGALSGRTGYWRSCLLAGLGAVVALWFGLLLHAFVLPWNHVQEGETAREAYQQFVRDHFLLNFLYIAIEGVLFGFVIATLVWAVRRVVTRPGKPTPESNAADAPR